MASAGHRNLRSMHLPLLNTLILLLSGTTVTWAHHAMVHGDREGLKWGLIATVVLGVIFTICQAYEYSHAAFGFSDNIYGATFFMATGSMASTSSWAPSSWLCVCSAHCLVTSPPPSTSALKLLHGTGTLWMWSGCSCLPQFTSGAANRTGICREWVCNPDRKSEKDKGGVSRLFYIYVPRCCVSV